ncbi:MAG TPA: HesA/MoeB/ThiF family protein [Dyella sp.]|uniref:HesA/MoeB/ThiF family protein n=1 Tax=Dyella sp. TaxID=1869338 RepID=UPI002F942544
MTTLRDYVPDYSRQMRLSAVGTEGQARLARSRVLVIGAGGLGSPALQYLAGAGIGHLGIVDGDTLDASNLHRQTLYNAADIGQSKAQLAARHVRALNPSIDAVGIERVLDAESIVSLFATYDLILECTDDMRSRYLCSDAAVLSGKPVIFASVYQYEGQLHVYRPGRDTPCLRCLWPQEPDPAQLGSCELSGVLGPVPGVLGTLQAVEALKLLLDLPGRLGNDLMLLDLLDVDMRRIRTRHSGHDCRTEAERGLAARRENEQLERSFPTLQAALLAGFQLVDLRERDEIESAPLDAPALWIPSGEVLDRATSFAHGRWLLVCARGARSRYAAEQLRARGLGSVYSLQGGWSTMQHATIAP